MDCHDFFNKNSRNDENEALRKLKDSRNDKVENPIKLILAITKSGFIIKAKSKAH